jgi:hypothetical protein
MGKPKLTPTTNDMVEAPGFGVPPGAAAVAPVPAVFTSAAGMMVSQRNPLMPKKVAIIGTQPSSRLVAPFGDPSWTIWGSSPGNMNVLPRVDAWFEMHVNLLWKKYEGYGKPYVAWMNECQWPVVAIDQRYVKRAVRYPIEDILAKFGRPLPYFFTSTFAYMMAYAIHVNVEEIGLYGVDMSSKDEYILQRSGGHHFICVAAEHGIKVTIPPESDLGQPPPLYGYSDDTPYGRKLAAREDETLERITQLEQQIQAAQNQLIFLRGAHEDQVYTRQVYGSVDQIAYNGLGRAFNGMGKPV